MIRMYSPVVITLIVSYSGYIQSGLQYYPLANKMPTYPNECERIYPTPELTPHTNIQNLPRDTLLKDLYAPQKESSGGYSPYWSETGDENIVANNSMVNSDEFTLLIRQCPPNFTTLSDTQRLAVDNSSQPCDPKGAQIYGGYIPYNCTTGNSDATAHPMIEDQMINRPQMQISSQCEYFASNPVTNGTFESDQSYRVVYEEQQPPGKFLSNLEKVTGAKDRKRDIQQSTIVLYSDLINIYFERINPALRVLERGEFVSSINLNRPDICSVLNYVYALSCLEVIQSNSGTESSRHGSLIESSCSFAQIGARTITEAMQGPARNISSGISTMGCDSIDPGRYWKIPPYAEASAVRTGTYKVLALILDTFHTLTARIHVFLIDETPFTNTCSDNSTNMGNIVPLISTAYMSALSGEQRIIATLCMFCRYIMRLKQLPPNSPLATSSSIGVGSFSCRQSSGSSPPSRDWKSEVHNQLVSFDSSLPSDKKLLSVCGDVHFLKRRHSLPPPSLYTILTSMMYLYILGTIHNDRDSPSDGVSDLHNPRLYKMQDGMEEMNSTSILSLAADYQMNLLLISHNLSSKVTRQLHPSDDSNSRYPGRILIESLILPKVNQMAKKRLYTFS